MKIALLSSGHLSNKKEATWITLKHLAEYYSSIGHETIIIARKHPNLPEIENLKGSKIYRLFNNFLFGYSTIKQLKINFDVIHGFSSSPIMALSTYIAGKACKKPKLIHTLKSYSKSKILNSMLKFPLKLMHKVTVPTTLAKNKLNLNKIDVIHSNIDTINFKPRNKEKLKQKYNIKEKVIFYYGAMRINKGVDYLIQALPKLKENVTCIMAFRSFTDEKTNFYKNMLKELNFKNTQFIFNDINIYEYVSMADVVVLAYPNIEGTEGNPSCLLESMASKTPVITTFIPEIVEITKNSVNLVPPKDIDLLAKEIDLVLKSPSKIKIEQAFKISQEFSNKKIAEKYLKLY